MATRAQNIARIRQLLDTPMPSRPSFAQTLAMGAPLILRQSKSALNTPSLYQSTAQGRRYNSTVFAPIFQRLCFSKCGQETSIASVAHLLRFCSPSNIPRFVVSIIVNAIQRIVLTWAPSQMIYKCLEGFKTKLNPASAIRGISMMVRHLATTFRIYKDLVFVGLCRFMSTKMMGVVADNTSTRLSLVVFQIGANCRGSVSARTFAFPDRVATRGDSDIADNGKKIKGLPYQVGRKFTWAVLRGIILNSHCSKDNSFVNLVRAVREIASLSRPAFIVA